jgi:hypothetical protein
MTDYRIELQAFVDAAASFTEPALGHYKAWAEAVARARVALSMPESSASTVCPITPPPELVMKWLNEFHAPCLSPKLALGEADLHIATQAARWGSDQELEACCEWFQEFYKTESWVKHDLKHFRAARRPKPPTLKEQALSELNLTADSDGAELSRTQVDLIRQALEQLPDDPA